MNNLESLISSFLKKKAEVETLADRVATFPPYQKLIQQKAELSELESMLKDLVLAEGKDVAKLSGAFQVKCTIVSPKPGYDPKALEYLGEEFPEFGEHLPKALKERKPYVRVSTKRMEA